jgi:peroxiredoxin
MFEKKKLWQSKAFKYTKGMYVKAATLQSVSDEKIRLPAGDKLIHLQFRRFAGCPVCNLHLQSFARKQQQLHQAGIKEVIVFHSGKEALLQQTRGFPFSLIADPKKKLYKAFGVASSPWALLHPKTFLTIIKGVVVSFIEYLQGKHPLPSLRPEGGSLGLPADFLIDTDGKIIDCYYGRHADDHWSVEDVLQKATVAMSNNHYQKNYQPHKQLLK